LGLTVDAELFALGYVVLFEVWRVRSARGSIGKLYDGELTVDAELLGDCLLVTLGFGATI
jgi:hypothetical protein